ncbi:hypothetical protein C1646_759527 [Rhizophagus diaphanus]|nr:hypothetical protein C1646_759527 [Rhizophagus diaphanus] [Rhizophagus sp. MUCL 43196]
MYSEDLSPLLDSFDTSPTISETSINEKFNMETETSTSFNSPTEKKEQISNIIQRANELQFVVQNLIKTHAPEKNGSLLFPSLNETVNVKGSLNFNESNTNNNNNNILLNFNENENQLLLKDQTDIISSQYDYDNIKDILDKSLFYSDICIMPQYFKEIYDTAYQDAMALCHDKHPMGFALRD